jgi:hypothetical protein
MTPPEAAIARKTPMRASIRTLKHSGLPRVMIRQVGPEADLVREYMRGLMERFGVSVPLPRALVNPIREAGIATLELRRLQADLEGLRERRGGGVRRQEERKLREEIRDTRWQVRWCEMRVESVWQALSGQNGHTDPLDALARDANRQERSR